MYTTFIKNDTLNAKASEIITKFRANSKGMDRANFIKFAEDSATGLAKPFISSNSILSIFNQIDTSKDGYVTVEEVDAYLRTYYNISLLNNPDKSVESFVEHIERTDNKPANSTCDGIAVGRKIYEGVKGMGTSDYVYEYLRDQVTKDNVVDVIAGFNGKSPKEHIMHYLADDDVHEGIASRIPKALLRKALELNLSNTPEYRALAEYYGAQGTPLYNQNGTVSPDDTFKLTKHCDDSKELTEGDEASKVDKMLEALADVIEETERKNKGGFFSWLM